jgi:electron transfer DM13
MNALSGRARLLLAVLVAAVGGGFAAGIVLARDGTGSALAEGPPGVVARGTFTSLGWSTNGTATIMRDSSGHLTLRFSKSFSTQPAPELYVYLAKYDGDRRTMWKQVAELRSASGNQAYRLPATTSPNVSVAIYCSKCNRMWGAAKLRPAGAAT